MKIGIENVKMSIGENFHFFDFQIFDFQQNRKIFFYAPQKIFVFDEKKNRDILLDH